MIQEAQDRLGQSRGILRLDEQTGFSIAHGIHGSTGPRRHHRASGCHRFQRCQRQPLEHGR